MTVSDSNPVQFWPINLKTYNELSYSKFVYKPCYNMEMGFDDPFRHDLLVDDSDFDYFLLGYYPDGTLWNTFQLLQIGSSLHFAYDFNWGTYPEVVNKAIRFFDKQSEVFANGDFETGSLTPWAEIADGGVFIWVADTIGGDKSAKMQANPAGAVGTSRNGIALRHAYPQIQTTAKTFQYKVVTGARTASSGSWSNANLLAVYYKDNIEIGTQTVIASVAASTTYASTFLTSITDFDTIGIRIVYHFSSSFGFAGSWRIDVCDFEPVALDSALIFKSDPIAVVENPNEGANVMIEYTNSVDYDDKDFQISNAVFNLRVPGLFWQENNPQTEELHQLSDGSLVTLRNDITEKRLLELDFLPGYMRKKIQKILAHDNVVIQDYTGELVEWKKQDEFTVSPVLRFTMALSQVWLTKKRIVLVNIGGDSGDTDITEKIYDFTYPPAYQ